MLLLLLFFFFFFVFKYCSNFGDSVDVQVLPAVFHSNCTLKQIEKRFSLFHAEATKDEYGIDITHKKTHILPPGAKCMHADCIKTAKLRDAASIECT